jgi:hypothetical protein
VRAEARLLLLVAARLRASARQASLSLRFKRRLVLWRDSNSPMELADRNFLTRNHFATTHKQWPLKTFINIRAPNFSRNLARRWSHPHLISMAKKQLPDREVLVPSHRRGDCPRCIKQFQNRPRI